MPQSRTSVRWTSARSRTLILDGLSLRDYPTLSKFHELQEVQYWHRTATDQRMEALAQIGLTNLYCITLNGSSYITDRGIDAMSVIPSVHSLGLEGTSITDAGVDVIARKMRPVGVNVAACTNVTVDGLLRLARTETLKDLSFSAGNMSSEDVLRILDAAPNLERLQITGVSEHLMRGAIEQAAAMKTKTQQKQIRIVYSAKGSISMDAPLPDRKELQ